MIYHSNKDRKRKGGTGAFQKFVGQAVSAAKNGIESSTLGLPDGTVQGVPYQQLNTSYPVGGVQSIKMSPGMNEAFKTMYKLLAFIPALIFLCVFLISWFDVLIYIKNENSQVLSFIKDPNLFIKNATDYHAIQYITTNTIEDEPYNIFLQQQLVGYAFKMFGLFILLLGCQFGIFYLLMFYSKIKQFPFNETIAIPFNDIGVSIITLVSGIILAGIYKLYFIKKVQTKLKETRDSLREIKRYIYSNLTTRGDFLAAVVTNDLQNILALINSEILKNDKNSCSQPISNCDSEVQKMVFTISFYTFLNNQIPEADPNYEIMNKIFTVENIQKKLIDPVELFYYKQPIYISNLFSSLQELNKTPFFTNTEREHVFHSKTRIIFQNCNVKLARLLNISEGKIHLRNFFFTFAFMATFILALFIAINYDKIQIYIDPIFAAIKAFFIGLFMKFTNKSAMHN